MAVLDSLPNALNTLRSTTPYGCSNRAFKDGYYLEQRRYLPDGSYTLDQVFIPHAMSTTCHYDKSLTDLRCQFCNHRGQGEIYDQSIRENGK